MGVYSLNEVGILQNNYDKSATTYILSECQETKSSADKWGEHQSYVGCVGKHTVLQLFSSQERWDAKQKFGYFLIILK